MAGLVRVFPHRMASQDSASWTWWVQQGDERQPCPPLLEGWDYSVPLTIGLSATFKVEEILASTGLGLASQMRAVAVVDCKSTQQRFVGMGELACNGDHASADISVEIPAGAVAQSLILSGALVLTQRAEGVQRVASLRGSRLIEADTSTLLLEGDSGRFPTEPVAFGARGLGPAPWTLMLSYEDVGDSFMGSVRLLVNTEHPIGKAVLDPKTASRYAGLMRADLMRGLIARLWMDDIGDKEFDENSVAGVVDAMCESLLDCSLHEAMAQFNSDPVSFELLIQRGLDPYRELVP